MYVSRYDQEGQGYTNDLSETANGGLLLCSLGWSSFFGLPLALEIMEPQTVVTALEPLSE